MNILWTVVFPKSGYLNGDDMVLLAINFTWAISAQVMEAEGVWM